MPSNSARPTIGFLCACTRDIWGPWIDAFERQLSTHGWTDGDTIDIEFREAKGLESNYTKYAKEFVKRKVNVIVTGGTQATLACKKEAAKVKPSIPVVFGTAGDPVDTKLVSSYNQPGNLTGMSNQQTNLIIKKLDLLRWFLDASPGKPHVGLVGNDKSPNVKLEMKIAETLAPTLGIKLRKGRILKQKDIAPVIKRLKGKVRALYVCTDPLITTHAIEVNAEATKAGLPTMHAFKEYLTWGGFMSYGPKFVDLFQNAADMVGEILGPPGGRAGRNMPNIPVGMTSDFEGAINIGPIGPVQSLDLNVPPSLLSLFDVVIR
jgi:putative ABC transport system substrate-binding protein